MVRTRALGRAAGSGGEVGAMESGAGSAVAAVESCFGSGRWVFFAERV